MLNTFFLKVPCRMTKKNWKEGWWIKTCQRISVVTFCQMNGKHHGDVMNMGMCQTWRCAYWSFETSLKHATISLLFSWKISHPPRMDAWKTIFLMKWSLFRVDIRSFSGGVILVSHKDYNLNLKKTSRPEEWTAQLHSQLGGWRFFAFKIIGKMVKTVGKPLGPLAV